MLPLVFAVFLLAPEQAKGLLQKGLVALQHGEFREARSDFEAASKIDANDPLIFASLAETYFRLGESDKSLTAAAKAEQLGGKNPVIGHALAIFYFRYAQALLKKQEFTQAADVLTTGLKADPRNAQLVLALGVARYGQRRFEEAIGEFLQVIEIDPTIEQPYVFLGKMLDQAGPHLAEIAKDCEAWNTQQPSNPYAPLVLAKVLLVSDPHSERAAELLRRSMELDGNDWEAHYELGVLLAGEHEYKNAAAELERSIQLNAKEAMPHYHLARVYDRLGEPERAQAERAIHQKLIGATN